MQILKMYSIAYVFLNIIALSKSVVNKKNSEDLKWYFLISIPAYVYIILK